MKVELKSLKYYPSMSEETNCFEAILVIDGKTVGTAKNRGTGGQTELWFDAPHREVEKALAEYCKTLPDRVADFDPTFTYKVTPDGLIDDLVTEALVAKEKARHAKAAEKQRLKNVAAGIPLTLEVERDDGYITWIGLRNEGEIEKALEYVARKHRTKVKSHHLLVKPS